MAAHDIHHNTIRTSSDLRYPGQESAWHYPDCKLTTACIHFGDLECRSIPEIEYQISEQEYHELHDVEGFENPGGRFDSKKPKLQTFEDPPDVENLGRGGAQRFNDSERSRFKRRLTKALSRNESVR